MIDKIYLGNTFISTVYLGDTLVKYNQSTKPSKNKKGIWILNSSNHLMKYDTTGTLLFTIQNKVMCVCFDEEGNAYCADNYLYTIRKYSPEGKLLIEKSVNLYVNNMVYKDKKIYVASYGSVILDSNTLSTERQISIDSHIYSITIRETDILLFAEYNYIFKYLPSTMRVQKMHIEGLVGSHSADYNGKIYAGKEEGTELRVVEINSSFMETGQYVRTSHVYLNSYGTHLYCSGDRCIYKIVSEFPYERSYSIKNGISVAENNSESELYALTSESTIEVYNLQTGSFKRTIATTENIGQAKNIYYA